ncbi:MAG: hypothetical protein WAU24_02560, partial [Chitinophagaceae bacterium]
MKNSLKLLFTTSFLIITIISFSQPGFLDPTFGNGGIIIAQRIGIPVGTAILPDQKILVAGGGGPYFYIDRFNPDGSNDESFGSDGRVSLNLENKRSNCSGITIQPDGKIILIGFIISQNPYQDIAIVRCKPDGSLDSSFGINGLTTINLKNYDYANDVLIQPDGKIVVIGNFTNSSVDNVDSYILRLNSDGNLDQNFGEEGITNIHYPVSSRNVHVSIQPDGKLLMGGTFNRYSIKPDYIVERFNTDGSVDNSYGVNGKTYFEFGENQSGDWGSELYDMKLQSDGKIVCAGESGTNQISMALCRFNSNGSIDIGFGENGGLITEYKNKESSIQSIYIQPDNNILATGFGLKSIGPGGYMILSRYKNDGTLDDGFGENGIQATYLDSLASGENVQLLQDNKILVTGIQYSHIVLARYNGDNVLAANFKEVKATQTNDAITITWQTLNESGTKSFTVERSGNANDYVGINTVPAKGVASTYNYTDKNPLSGTSYYRIRENAANGTNTFSPVVKVVFNDN